MLLWVSVLMSSPRTRTDTPTTRPPVHKHFLDIVTDLRYRWIMRLVFSCWQPWIEKPNECHFFWIRKKRTASYFCQNTCLSLVLCVGFRDGYSERLLSWYLTLYFIWLFATLFLHRRKTFKSWLILPFFIPWDHLCFLEVDLLQNVLLLHDIKSVASGKG